MPLLTHFNITDTSTAAIWKIEEPISFFTEATGLNPDIKNDNKKIEHVAGRFLLQFLAADLAFEDVLIDSQGKPYHKNNLCHFSISHSYPYIAVIVDTANSTGIDIQKYHPGITNIQYKYLSEREQQLFNNDTKLLTLAWSIKETVYKWHGKKGVEFIEDIPIADMDINNMNDIVVEFNMNVGNQRVKLRHMFEPDFVCTFIFSIE